MGTPTVAPFIVETVFPEIALLLRPTPTMPQMVVAPVAALVIPEMLLLVMFVFGDVTTIPAVLSRVPAFVRVLMVLLLTAILVTAAPAWTLMPVTAALLPVLVVVIPVIMLPEMVALSVPVKIAIPTGASALESEILPMVLLVMVTPFAPWTPIGFSR